VTRGTRLKKPSSSCGFVRKARGAWGSWGLKTDIFFSLFSSGQQLPEAKKIKNKKIKIIIVIIYFF
jgi:hypothetical protein